MQNDTNIREEMTKNSITVYEISYLLLPSISQEKVQNKAVTLKEMLQKIGGKIVTDEDPVLIDLAYSMTKIVGIVRHKCNSGYFGWIKLEMFKDGIGTVKKMLDNNDEVLRYLIIKTVRENTLINGKMKLKSEERIKTMPVMAEDEVVDMVDVIPEKDIVIDEIDKSIEDLVII